MSETSKYLDALKEIESFCKSNKIEINENIISTILSQCGIDFRLRRDSSTSSTKYPETKEPLREFIPATEGQVKALKLMNKFKEGLSKAEAWNIIHEGSNKKEQEY